MNRSKIAIATVALWTLLLIPVLTFAFSTDVPVATQLTGEEMQQVKGGHGMIYGYTYLNGSPMGYVNVNINGQSPAMNCYVVSTYQYYYQSDYDTDPAACTNLPAQTYSVRGNKYYGGRTYWSSYYYVTLSSGQHAQQDVYLY